MDCAAQKRGFQLYVGNPRCAGNPWITYRLRNISGDHTSGAGAAIPIVIFYIIITPLYVSISTISESVALRVGATPPLRKQELHVK